MNKLAVFLIFSLIFCFISCEKIFIQPSVENTNTDTFDYVWEYTKHHYCCFDTQEVDWDSVYQTYSPRVNDDISSDSLRLLLHQMLSTLKDEGVVIAGEFGELNYQTDNSMYPANLDSNVIDAVYKPYNIRANAYTFSEGIMYVNKFEEARFYSLLDDFVEEESNLTGLIIDLRNWTSDDHKIEYLDGNNDKTIDEELSNVIRETEDDMIGTYRYKTGQGEDDYYTSDLLVNTPDHEIYTNEIPVIVLCNRETYAGSNRTVYGLSTLPDVTVIGDRTGGGNIDLLTISLPNGWFLKLPKGTVFDTDGIPINRGIDPDIFINDDPTTTDKDEIIERALELLN